MILMTETLKHDFHNTKFYKEKQKEMLLIEGLTRQS